MTRAISLLVTAELDGAQSSKGQVSVAVRLELVLENGGKILLLDDRGWGTNQQWTVVSETGIRQTALVVVGPDEPFEGMSQKSAAADHWQYLGLIAQQHGFVIGPLELCLLTHEVRLGPKLRLRLGQASGV